MSSNFCLSLLFSWWTDVHVCTCRYQSNYGHYNSGGSAAAAAAAAGMLLSILLPAPVHIYLKWPENLEAADFVLMLVNTRESLTPAEKCMTFDQSVLDLVHKA